MKGPAPIHPVERILRRLVIEPDGCWLWTGSTVDGYGQIELAPEAGKRKTGLVHRVLWEFLRGPVPDGLDLHHDRCRFQACANPAHLALVDHVEHARHHMPRSTSCARCGTSDWYETPTGRRNCRECRRRRRHGNREWTP